MASDGTVTLVQINDALTTTLATATGISVSQSYNELTEGIPVGDMPLLQVYFENLDCDPDVGTERRSFQGAIRTKVILFHADVFCRQRSNIGEDMAKVLETTDAIVDVLETQNRKAYFDLHGIKALDWRADRVTFDYAGVLYAGIRFYITVYVF